MTLEEEFPTIHMAAPARAENVKFYAGAAKVALGLIPPVFKVKLGLAMQWGARKYGPWNWRGQDADPVRISTYIHAMQRHLDEFAGGEDLASDTGVEHLAHIAASCAILLDAAAAGRITDDRLHGVDIRQALENATALMRGWPEDHPYRHAV